jgi:hypothetical protein
LSTDGGAASKISQRDLPALLVEDGAVASGVLERALARQREAGGALDTALLELRALPEDRLVGLLARSAGLPGAPERAWKDTDARARRVFPSRVAERHGLAPFALDGRELSLVATYPVDLGLLDEISFMLSLHLTAHVGPEWRVRHLIHRLYGGTLPPRLMALATGAPPVPPLASAEPPPPAAPAPAPSRHAAAPAPRAAPAQPSAAEARPASGAAPHQEPPSMPTVFDDGEEDALATALAQAVEAVELGFFSPDDEAPGQAPPEGAPGAEVSAPSEPSQESPLAPPVLDRSAPPRWTLEEARAALAAAKHRDEVVMAALRYTRDFFEFTALFAVTRDAVAGHDALGLEDGARDLARSVALYTSDPGVLRTVMETRGPYLGPVTREPGTEAVLRGLGRGTPRTVLAFPVQVRGRIVCLVYADNGEAPVSARRLGDLLTLLAGVGASFERVLREQKKREGVTAAPPPESWRTREPGKPPLPPVPVAPPPEGEAAPAGWAAPTAAPASVEATLAELPMADENDAQLIEAVAEDVLAPVPATSAELAFEEPEPPAREDDADLDVTIDEDPAEEDAAEHVALPPPEEPLSALADRALDPDPAVAAAAVEALAARRREPNLREATDRLRRALLSGVSGRTTGAARALRALRDADSVPLLVQVLETADPPTAEAAAAALRGLTLQLHGADARRWLAWWKENRGRGRADWLFGALTHPLREIRAAAAAELSEAAPPPTLYHPDMEPHVLEQAARDWASWWSRSGLVL